jgi:hypothetical protein
MLKRGKPVQHNMIFRVPFGCTLPWHEFVSQYPLILPCMDGLDRTSTLEFYYSRNPLNGIYEFESEDAENDIADMIGISFAIVAKGETQEDEDARRRTESEKTSSNLSSNLRETETLPKASLELESLNSISVKEEERRIHQRELFAFLNIENEKEREFFLSSDLTEEEYQKYSNEDTTTTVESESNENRKRCKKSDKKERRRQNVASREKVPSNQQKDERV